MDFKNSTDFRHGRLVAYLKDGNNRYNYAEQGILNKCLPKILFKGNPMLTTLLQTIDVKIVMLLKYVDRLKDFKNLHKY